MRQIIPPLVTAVSLLFSLGASRAEAQTSIGFRNAMQSVADVVITEVGSTTPVRFAIGANNVVNFNFTGALFNIQVIPRDEPDSGFRFAGVDLRSLSANTIDGILTLDGQFGPDQKKLVCHRRGLLRRRCCCRWCVVRGERTAVDMTGNLRGGGVFNRLENKMTYDEVMSPF